MSSSWGLVFFVKNNLWLPIVFFTFLSSVIRLQWYMCGLNFFQKYVYTSVFLSHHSYSPDYRQLAPITAWCILKCIIRCHILLFLRQFSGELYVCQNVEFLMTLRDFQCCSRENLHMIKSSRMYIPMIRLTDMWKLIVVD
jgi:hypothetical protein